MKFSDLDKNLVTEAPGKEGKLARMGTKLKKKLGPTKDIRNRAAGKAEVQDEALNIKHAFQKWAGRQGVPNTAKSLIAFFQNNNYNEEYAAKVPEIAVKLKFEPEGFDRETEQPANEPTPDKKPDAKAQPDDSADQKADEVGDEEQEDLISPEEMTGEQDDEVEEEVDMSASIYESKLAYLLMEDTKLKDNQMDTLLVRLVQAVGVKSMPQQDQEQEKEPSKYRKFMNKANKVAFGDLVGGDGDEEYSGGSGGSEIDSLTGREKGALKSILNKVLDGKSLESDDIKVAKKIVREL